MATLTAAPGAVRAGTRARTAKGETVHRLLLGVAACAAAALLLFLAVRGFPYYTLSLEDRPFSPLHTQLRSSGSIGLRLAFLSLAMFGFLFLYPLRKRSKWLSSIGSTRRWLNFHILLGMSTPLVVTFHTSFRTHGIAGLAYWTMMIVALSGVVGRYVYAKIPRNRTAAELSMAELEAEAASLAANLREQALFREEDLAPLLAVPSPEAVRRMNPLTALCIMLRMDLARPLLVGRLRRHALGGSERIATLGGLLASHNSGLETVVSVVRRQSRLRFSIAFLHTTERVFHLWHAVHRPFSISFVFLLAVHIAVALSMGGAWRIH
jgi:hypothetical protein